MKIKVIFAFTMLLLSLPNAAQTSGQAITLKYERDHNDELSVVAENADYCDYHFVLTNTNILPFLKMGPATRMGHGKTTVMIFSKTSSSMDTSYRYRIYRGNTNAKINLDYIYPLPVKGGDSIRFSPANNSHYTSVFDMKFANDTVYASRAGIVCNDQLNDFSSLANRKKERIIVYHKDGSFSEYSSYGSSLVHPNDAVEIGQPIAVMKANEKKQKRLYFSVYYLDKNKLDNNSSVVHSALIPLFHTAGTGGVKLERSTTYVSELTDELKMQDMSKGEKKKYLKKMEKKK